MGVPKRFLLVARLGPLCALLLVSAPLLPAQPAPAPPPAGRDEPGLVLTVEPLGGNAPGDSRPVRLPAIYVTAGQSASPFVGPGPFRATWTGDLSLRLRERMAFVAEGRGKVTIRLKDKVVFEAAGDDLAKKAGDVVRIDKGRNPIVITYESPASGDAFLRVLWKEQHGLRADPVPPTSFTHDGSDEAARDGTRVRRGRQLFADLRCAKCHDAGAAEGAVAMPDLATDAPALTDAGARLNREWVAAWVADPRALRKDAHMPRVLQTAEQAADVAAYLASLGGAAASPQPPGPKPELVTRGGQLFSTLLCVACHRTPDAATIADDDSRVPLGYVAAKFRPDALRQYLLKPEAHYAWNPMPNFRLGEDEASALTSYLLAKSGKKVEVAKAGDAGRGKQLVAASGCLNCHAIEGSSTALKPAALATITPDHWQRGCLAANAEARKNAPDFGLSGADRDALIAFGATDRSSLARETPMEFSLRQVAAMRCTACHARDGNESLVGTDYAADAAALAAAFPLPAPSADAHGGEVLAPDQRPPVLTWAGEKLRPEWAAAFVGGHIGYKPRPYLRARMPAWPARAALLAQGLAAEHGYAPSTPKDPAPDEQMAPVGRKLTGAAGGFSCVQCHAVGAAPPLAPFEAPALNMQYVTQRIRKDYYDRWMLNPIKVDPQTKMPAFADAEGKSAIRDVFDGDALKQFEAVWQFLLRGKDVKPPG